jgi:hypothetical protein
MTDFAGNGRVIKSGIKNYRCDSCGHVINIGEPRWYQFGVYEGDTYTTDCHVECHAAELDLASEFNCWGEEWPWLNHIEDGDCGPEMWPIVRDRHPIAWARVKPSYWSDDSEDDPIDEADQPIDPSAVVRPLL